MVTENTTSILVPNHRHYISPPRPTNAVNHGLVSSPITEIDVVHIAADNAFPIYTHFAVL